jgi:hypothetical protein
MNYSLSRNFSDFPCMQNPCISVFPVGLRGGLNGHKTTQTGKKNHTNPHVEIQAGLAISRRLAICIAAVRRAG